MADANATWTVRRLLEWTTAFFTRKQVDAPRLSAELLLAHVLEIPRIKLYTDYERPLTELELSTYRELVRRGGEHEPIAYLTGTAHFFDIELAIRPPVLIPRPDTETLVENVLHFVKQTPGMEAARILDLCTGSGCIACVLAKHLPHASVAAVDLDPAAVELAGANAAKLGLAERLKVYGGDLFAALPQHVEAAPFDIITANPPYIRSAEMTQLDRNVRDYESHLALDGGADGLAVHRRILQVAPQRLNPGGQLYLEIGFDQGPAAMEMAAGVSALAQPRLLRDYGGKDRVLVLGKPR